MVWVESALAYREICDVRHFRYHYPETQQCDRVRCSTLILAAIQSSNCTHDSDVTLIGLARLSSEVCRSTHDKDPATKLPFWSLP